MHTKRLTIVLISLALLVSGIMFVKPLYKEWRINTLVLELQSRDEPVRSSASAKLRNIGLHNQSVKVALLQAIDEPSLPYWGVRAEMVSHRVPHLFDLLVDVGPDAVPSLIEMLNHADYRVRGIAADTLERMGPAAEPAIPALMKAANNDQERNARYFRVNKPLDALIKLGRPAIPTLIRSLQSEKHDIRLQAIEALILMGQQAEAAVPALIEMLDQQERGAAADALISIGEPAVPILRKALEQTDETVQSQVERVLQNIKLASDS